MKENYGIKRSKENETSNNSKPMAYDTLLAVVIPSGKDWDKFMISPSILETKRGATAYEAGFKDCIIEIKKRIREYERNNR